jgi:site-specific DNA recombinase
MDKVFAIYSRKSRFTGKDESVENQIEMCREYLRIHFDEE